MAGVSLGKAVEHGSGYPPHKSPQSEMCKKTGGGVEDTTCSGDLCRLLDQSETALISAYEAGKEEAQEWKYGVDERQKTQKR